MMLANFGHIVVADFEYEVGDGDLPNVSVHGGARARREPRARAHHPTLAWRIRRSPPFDIGPDALFVAYSAWAEMKCFATLGWKFPTHIFDQHTAYLAASNVLLPHEPDVVRKKPKRGLADACHAYGLEGWERHRQGSHPQAIGDGRWRWKYTPEQILDYCAEDVRMSASLLREQLRGRDHRLAADTELVTALVATTARRSSRSSKRAAMPIDIPTWNLIQENKDAVIGELLRRFDPSHGDDDPIYTPEGKWSYARFEPYLAAMAFTLGRD